LLQHAHTERPEALLDQPSPWLTVEALP
jgi:hypothetical protein